MSWSYTYSNETMTWTKANEWCEGQTQTLMFILSERDNDFLKNKLPKLNNYYWIGLRKKGSNWFWYGTTKVLEGSGSWASNEPNNKNQDEDCVELYINEQERHGKWNDEKCYNRKHALCYKGKDIHANGWKSIFTPDHQWRSETSEYLLGHRKKPANNDVLKFEAFSFCRLACRMGITLISWPYS